jgi:hypothetical protein
MRNQDKKFTRRAFLRQAALATAVTAGAGYLVGCKPSDSGGKSGGKSAGGEAAGADVCTDISGLTETEKKTRQSLNYVEKSKAAGKNCLNCSLYQPEKYGDACGGCQVMKGPVMAKGNCTAWAAKAG